MGYLPDEVRTGFEPRTAQPVVSSNAPHHCTNRLCRDAIQSNNYCINNNKRQGVKNAISDAGMCQNGPTDPRPTCPGIRPL